MVDVEGSEKSYRESRLPRLRQASPEAVGGLNASDCHHHLTIGTRKAATAKQTPERIARVNNQRREQASYFQMMRTETIR